MEKIIFILYLVVSVLGVMFSSTSSPVLFCIVFLVIPLCTLVLILMSIGKDPRTGKARLKFPKTGFGAAFLLILCFQYFQITPLPAAPFKFISPEAFLVGQMSVPAPVEAQGGAREQFFTLAPYSDPVEISIMHTAGLGLFFLGFIYVLNTRRRIDLFFGVMLAAVCLKAVFSVFGFLENSEAAAGEGALIGLDFVLGAGVITSAAFSGALVSRPRKKNRRPRVDESVSEESRRSISRRPESFTRLFAVLCGIISSAALVSSLQWNALTFGAALIVLFLIVFTLKAGFGRVGAVALLVVVAAAVAVLAILPGNHVSKSALPDVNDVEVFKDYFWAGAGMGSIEHLPVKYQMEESTWSQKADAWSRVSAFFAELGVMGACLSAAAFAWFIMVLMRRWRKRRDPYAVFLGFLPLVILVYTCMFSFAGYRAPGTEGFIAVFSLGAGGWAALHLKRRARYQKVIFDYHAFPVLSPKGMGVFCIVLALAFLPVHRSLAGLLVKKELGAVSSGVSGQTAESGTGGVLKAIRWEPGSAEHRYRLYLALSAERDALPADRGEDRQFFTSKIIDALEAAIELNPMHVRFHLAASKEYAALREMPDYRSRWFPAADISVERAAYLAGDKGTLVQKEIGDYWIMRSKTISPVDPRHRTAWEKALRHYRAALKLKKGEDFNRMKEDIFDYIWHFYPDESFLAPLKNLENKRS